MTASWLWFVFVLVVVTNVNSEQLSEARVRFGFDVEETSRKLQVIRHDDDWLSSSTPYYMSVCTASSENACGSGTCCYYYQTEDDDFFTSGHYREWCETTPGSGFTGTCTWYMTGTNTYVCTTNYNKCINPTSQPTSQPTRQPTRQPSSQPTRQPSSQPTRQPSSQPTRQPSSQPTRQPTRQPTGQPTRQPSSQPSSKPTSQPSSYPTNPTSQPTGQPSTTPTSQPTCDPSMQPTSQPTVQPSRSPTSQPSNQPTSKPTSQPSMQPSSEPTMQPTSKPSSQPTSEPSNQPTTQPSSVPSGQPSGIPTEQPTGQPTSEPTSQPSSQPSSAPSSIPTSSPTSKPTIPDLLLINPLSLGWNAHYTEIKIRAYLVIYLAFFIGLYFILYLLDKSNLVKRTLDKIEESAYASNCRRLCNVLPNSFRPRKGYYGFESSLLKEIHRKSEHLSNEYAEQYRLFRSSRKSRAPTLSTGDVDIDGIEDNNRFEVDQSSLVYFSKRLLDASVNIGTDGVIYKGGYTVPVLGYVLAPGRIEDIILYICNNHSIIGCCFCYENEYTTYNRSSRRVVFSVQHTIAFFITIMTSVFFMYAGLGAAYNQATSSSTNNLLASQLFDVICTSPFSLVVADYFQKLYSLDFRSGGSQKFRFISTTILKSVKIFLLLTFSLICLGCLVLASILTTGDNCYGNIIGYSTQVIVITFLLDIINPIMLYEDRYYLGIYVFGTPVVVIGQLFLELLVEGDKNYVDLSYIVWKGVIKVERVVAVKDVKKYVPDYSPPLQDQTDNPMYDTSSTDSKTADEYCYKTYEQEETNRNSVFVELVTIHAKHVDVNKAMIDAVEEHHPTDNFAINPMIAVIKERKQADVNKSINVDDDDDLIEESNSAMLDQTDYDINNDESLEVKSPTKAFKANTRRSFIQKVEFFQNKLDNAYLEGAPVIKTSVGSIYASNASIYQNRMRGDSSEKSSVNNTMNLHSKQIAMNPLSKPNKKL